MPAPIQPPEIRTIASLNINGSVRSHDAEPETPLLWVLREQLGMTGTKYGCGIAQCGACTVHIDGVATRSCVRPVSTIGADEKIVTIEGLSPNASHPLQKAWAELDVPQCGFCQSGMLMAAAAAKLTPPTVVVLKNPKDWKIAGKPVKRLDTVHKTDGSQVYGMDLKLPGMLNAAIRDCPVMGGTLTSFDAAAVMGMRGVRQVVRVSDTAVAVVADTWYRAKKAVDALPVQWNEGPHAKLNSADIAAMLKTGLDASGKLQALHMRISGQSILAGLLPAALQNGKDPVTFQGLNAGGAEGAFGYSVPNLLIDHAMRNPPVRPGFWRGVNLNHNAIYVECFIDELAHAAGQDPLAFRRAMLGGAPKHLAVLNKVAEGAGWGTAPKPVDGLPVHRGLAAIHGFGSFVAACAEVSVSPGGDLRVHRIVAATDSGHAVNPQQIAAQVEGSFAYGLSGALFEACTLKDGRFEQTNFHTYPALLMAQMPKVEATVMPSGGFWGGVGEPTIAVAAPAVLNAIFAATGKRIRDLPLSQHSLKRA